MHFWSNEFFDSDFKFSADELLMEFYVQTFWKYRPLCCQFFQKGNDIFLYWNYDFDFDEIIEAERIFSGENQLLSYTEMKKSKAFYDYLNQIHPPKSVKLTEQQAETVRKLYQEKLPAVENVPRGCDGHSYLMKIYGESVQKYHSWCIMPEQWAELAKLIAFSMEIIQPEPVEQYLANGLA